MRHSCYPHGRDVAASGAEASAAKRADPAGLRRAPAVSPSRRRLLQTVVWLPAVAALPSRARQEDGDEGPLYRSFFTDPEQRFVDAAVLRLIPEGDDGTGAQTAAVGFFIDRQMAGPYGRAETWYMKGPFQNGEAEQGYQLAYTPAALYRTAIREIDAWCRDQHGKPFAELPPAQQDDVLAKMEKGDVKLKEVPSDAFFAMLWQNAQEGFLSDPMYGGNRNFTGWKLIGFPGPRYNYVKEITEHGKPYRLPTVGLLGRDGKRVLKG